MIATLLNSIQLLAEGVDSFNARCVKGLEADEARIQDLMERSLMLVTALAPEIGYDKAAEVAKNAHKKGLTLLESALELGYVDEKRFREIVRPENMTGPND